MPEEIRTRAMLRRFSKESELKKQSNRTRKYWRGLSNKDRDARIKVYIGVKSENPRAKDSRKQMSLSGKRSWASGKRKRCATVFRGVKYAGVWLRSSWEYAFARWLRRNGIRYRYEFVRFVLSFGSYRPDFYLPDFGLFVEIKGFWREGAEKRFHGFLKAFPDLEICVLDGKALRSLGVLA